MSKSKFYIHDISELYNKVKPSTLNSTEFWVLCEKLNSGNFKDISASGFYEHTIIELKIDNEKFRLTTWDGDIETFERGEMYSV